MKKLHVLLAAAALLAVAAGAAYAAIPSSSGTISACKDNKGTLKVIDAESGQSCSNNQQPLTWNQQGPAGPPGPAGISGYEVVLAGSAADSNAVKSAYAECPAGKSVIGGGARAVLGYQQQSAAPGVVLWGSLPVFADSGWLAQARESVPTDEPWLVYSYAICATVN